MYVHVYIHNTKEYLALNLEVGKIYWHSTVIANNRDQLSVVESAKWLIQLNFGQPYDVLLGKWQMAGSYF